MIDRAFQWADKNGKSRTNSIHGDPEAFLVISDTFCISSTDVEENEQAGSIEIEDWGSQKHAFSKSQQIQFYCNVSQL